MSPVAEATARIVADLPPENASAVLDFARYPSERFEDDEWERLFAAPPNTAWLDQEVEQAKEAHTVGLTAPLDPDRP